MQPATKTSRIETQDVRAARVTIRKKTAPTTPPIGPMAAKTLGRETNIRLGPAALRPSVPMKTNTAGMIMTPARNATAVSMPMTCSAFLERLSSLRM